MAEIICYGCGKDITAKPTNRCYMLGDSCSKALPVWKRLVADRLSELSVDVNVNEVLSDGDGFVGRMCRPCVSSMQRLNTLECSTRANVADAVEAIMNSSRWTKLQSRKRRIESSSLSEPRAKKRITANLPRPCGSASDQKTSPDVAVSCKTDFKIR